MEDFEQFTGLEQIRSFYSFGWKKVKTNEQKQALASFFFEDEDLPPQGFSHFKEGFSQKSDCSQQNQTQMNKGRLNLV
jgi:hypothetical protein